MKLESERHEPLNILKAAVVYFALVFGAGFVLGPIRILFIVPRFGVRLAELMEFPVMLVVIVLAARWLVRKFQLAAHKAPSARSRETSGTKQQNVAPAAL
jgi:hypothetical protein